MAGVSPFQSVRKLNPALEVNRQWRAKQLLRRLPIELGLAILTLRDTRFRLHREFKGKIDSGDIQSACALAGHLIKSCEAIANIAKRYEVRNSPRNLIVDLVPSTHSSTNDLENPSNPEQNLDNPHACKADGPDSQPTEHE